MNEDDLRAKHYVKNADGSWSKTSLPVGSKVTTPNLSGPDYVSTVTSKPKEKRADYFYKDPITGERCVVNAPVTAAAHNAPQVGHSQLYPSENPLVEVSKRAERKRIRQDRKPLLNKLETEWFNKLQECYPSTMIWKQALRWKLGNGIWYKPDFVLFAGWTQKPSELTCYEVKGPHSFRGGFENLKVAASLYPEVRWILVWKESGTWRHQEVLP